MVNYQMRTSNQIKEIKKFESDPFQVFEIISAEQVGELIQVWHQSTDKVHKETGPTTVKLEKTNPVLQHIMKKLKPTIGECSIRYASFFDVERPHVIHIDDDFDYPVAYKAITIPLWHNGQDTPDFYVFDQHYYGGPAKFFKNRKTEPKVHYNKPIIDYSTIDGLQDTGINEYHMSQLDHLDNEWLEGLTVKESFSWTLGSAIVFDSLQLHCSGNFANQGVKRKIGLSIFTKDPK